MTYDNVPDDWYQFYSKCTVCGYNSHGSEGYWCYCDDKEDESLSEEESEESTEDETTTEDL